MARERIRVLLEFLELSEKARGRIRELSGGMQRRLVIARALLNNPKLLILDEPTTGLDPQVRHLIWDKLRQLRAQGTTILLTTHYMEEAFQICDTVLIMDKGRKVLEDNPRDLLRENIEAYVLEVPITNGTPAIQRGRPARRRPPGPRRGHAAVLRRGHRPAQGRGRQALRQPVLHPAVDSRGRVPQGDREGPQ